MNNDEEKGKMTVEEAGHKGGERVKELIEEGEELEEKEGKVDEEDKEEEESTKEEKE